jgi:hypothetical protein
MIMVDINYDVGDALGKKWDWKGLSTTLVAKGKGCTARLLGVQIPNWTHPFSSCSVRTSSYYPDG